MDKRKKWVPKSDEAAREEGRRVAKRLQKSRERFAELTARNWAMLGSYDEGSEPLEKIYDEHGNLVEIRFGSPEESSLSDELILLLTRDPNPSDAS